MAFQRIQMRFRPHCFLCYVYYRGNHVKVIFQVYPSNEIISTILYIVPLIVLHFSVDQNVIIPTLSKIQRTCYLFVFRVKYFYWSE